MDNKDILYLQYNQVNWANQEKTGINSGINTFIIENVVSKNESSTIKLFDIGFGIGFFIKMLVLSELGNTKNLIIEGCEPSTKNFKHFNSVTLQDIKETSIQTYNSSFLETNTQQKFDFMTAIYVIPHFVMEDLDKVAKKIAQMLEQGGQFIMVVANEAYLQEKNRSIVVEENTVEYNGKKYKEVLHSTDLPDIGRIVDYNREHQLYIDVFANNGLKLISSTDVDDNGFVCTASVFQKA